MCCAGLHRTDFKAFMYIERPKHLKPLSRIYFSPPVTLTLVRKLQLNLSNSVNKY